MKDTWVIMGSHPGTRAEFDWARTDCDVIVFNEAMHADWVKRADYVIQIHLPVIWRNPGNRNDPNHYAWLKSGNTPIILMQDVYDDVPNSERYPIEEVCKYGHRYLTSSAAYAIAYGMYKKYKRIEIYGVEMATQTEYAHQRPGVAYWIGMAEGAGITVDFHGTILDCPLYGYEGDIKFKLDYFDERIGQLEITSKQAQEEYNKAREEANNFIVNFLKTGTQPEKVIQYLQKQATLGSMFGLQDGARQEVKRYKDKAAVQIEATGDYLFSRQEFEHSATSFIKQRDDSIITAQKMAEECQRQFDNVRSTGNLGKRKARMNNFIEYVAKYIQEAVKVGMFDGAHRENKLFMAKLDELVRMAGGDRSAEVMLEHYEQVNA